MRFFRKRTFADPSVWLLALFPAGVIVAALKDAISFTIPNWVSGLLALAFFPALNGAIKAGQARARAGGKHMGRPRRVFDRREVVRLRDVEHLSWPEIARRTGAGVGTVVQAYKDLTATV